MAASEYAQCDFCKQNKTVARLCLRPSKYVKPEKPEDYTKLYNEGEYFTIIRYCSDCGKPICESESDIYFVIQRPDTREYLKPSLTPKSEFTGTEIQEFNPWTTGIDEARKFNEFADGMATVNMLKEDFNMLGGAEVSTLIVVSNLTQI